MLSSLSCRGAERATCWRRRLRRKTDIMCVCCLLPRKGCQLSVCGEEIERQQHNKETMSFPLAISGIMAISHSNFVVTTRKRIWNLENKTRGCKTKSRSMVDALATASHTSCVSFRRSSAPGDRLAVGCVNE